MARGSAALGAPAGWVSSKGRSRRLVIHAKGERKIRSSRNCASETDLKAGGNICRGGFMN